MGTTEITFGQGVARETVEFLAEWLKLGATPEQVVRVINGDVLAAYEYGDRGTLSEAVFTGWCRIEALRQATGHRGSLPKVVVDSVR